MASKLILLRHGESEWNLSNRFTGWHDVALSERGVEEAREAGRLMAADGLRPHVLHTSLLRRAISTANLALDEMGLLWLPVRRSWRLNERHYGALETLNKRETAEKFGEEQVHLWRRSFDVPPPRLEWDDERHPRFDARYRYLPPDLLPASESLKEVIVRMLPYWYDAIVPDIADGACVLVTAHGNSLRALVKHLDGLTDQEIVDLNLPTGIPRVYELDEQFRATGWRYLGSAAEAEARAAAVARQASAKA